MRWRLRCARCLNGGWKQHFRLSSIEEKLLQNGDAFSIGVKDGGGSRLAGLDTPKEAQCTDTSEYFPQCQAGLTLGIYCDQASPCTINYTIFAEACTSSALSTLSAQPSLAAAYAKNAEAHLALDRVSPASCGNNPTLSKCAGQYKATVSESDQSFDEGPALDVTLVSTSTSISDCPDGIGFVFCECPYFDFAI